LLQVVGSGIERKKIGLFTCLQQRLRQQWWMDSSAWWMPPHRDGELPESRVGFEPFAVVAAVAEVSDEASTVPEQTWE